MQGALRAATIQNINTNGTNKSNHGKTRGLPKLKKNFQYRTQPIHTVNKVQTSRLSKVEVKRNRSDKVGREKTKHEIA